MTKLIDQVEINKYANDFIRRVEKQCQEEVYTDFKLAMIKLDWSTKRGCSRGGMYADGPGINIAMASLVKPQGDIYYSQEYKSFDNDPEIGGIYSRNRWHRLEMVILHEIAHALQYYSYKVNNYRCKPHGPAFKNFYRRLRNIHLNPFLEDQKELGDYYKEAKRQIEKLDQFAWMSRAASAKNT